MSTPLRKMRTRSLVAKLQYGSKRLVSRLRAESPRTTTFESCPTTLPKLLTQALLIEARAITLETETRRASVAVRNVSDAPIVLFPSIHRLPESQATSIMVMPLMAELRAGEATRIDYILVAGHADTEQLFRARFAWLESSRSADCQEAEASIPLLVRPSELRSLDDPQHALSASLTPHGDVIIQNEGEHLVFVSPIIALLPSNRTFVIAQRYIAPRSWQLCREVDPEARSLAIRVTAERICGTPTFTVDIPLQTSSPPDPYRTLY